MNLYEEFKAVIILTENVRLTQDSEEVVYYAQFLIIISNETFTEEDFNHIRMRCSNHSLTDTGWKDHGFCQDYVTLFFFTN